MRNAITLDLNLPVRRGKYAYDLLAFIGCEQERRSKAFLMRDEHDHQISIF